MTKLNENTSKIQSLIEKISTLPKDRYEDGYNEGYNVGYNESLDIGKEQGKKELLNSFWNDFLIQVNANGVVLDRTVYQYAFGYFTPEFFYPTKNLKMTYANYSFDGFNPKGEYFNLKTRLEECGVQIDLSACRDVSGMFQGSKINIIPTIDLTASNIVNLNTMFRNAIVETVEKLILKDDGSQTFNNNTFNTTTLKNIAFDGVIGNTVTFVNCTLLTKASIESIIGALSTTKTGQSLTLSLTAVNKAFETSLNANDGSSSTEWKNLINTRENWTINLS